MTVVKICGITNLEDALAAVEFGADALGFNFYRPSSRYLEPLAARQIIERLPESIQTVGVFVSEEDVESTKAIARDSGVTTIQIHGDEPPEYYSELYGFQTIKAFSVGETFAVDRILEYKVDAVMLDTKHQHLHGGTGQAFDWSIAASVNELDVRLFLAGGLSPENVGEAIRTVRPFAVDACSSLEKMPGRKDQVRMKSFLQAVRDADG